jgi:hypothetical protein
MHEAKTFFTFSDAFIIDMGSEGCLDFGTLIPLCKLTINSRMRTTPILL